MTIDREDIVAIAREVVAEIRRQDSAKHDASWDAAKDFEQLKRERKRRMLSERRIK